MKTSRTRTPAQKFRNTLHVDRVKPCCVPVRPVNWVVCLSCALLVGKTQDFVLKEKSRSEFENRHATQRKEGARIAEITFTDITKRLAELSLRK